MGLNDVFEQLEKYGFNVETVPYVYPLYRVKNDENDYFEWIDVAENDDGTATFEHYVDGSAVEDFDTDDIEEAVDYVFHLIG